MNRTNILLERNHVIEVRNILTKNDPKVFDESINLLPVKMPIRIAEGLTDIFNTVVVRCKELILVDIDK